MYEFDGLQLAHAIREADPTLLVIAGLGLLLLIIIAVGAGASLDTERQRVIAREVARERRERNDELRALREERHRLAEERRRWRDGSPPDSGVAL